MAAVALSALGGAVGAGVAMANPVAPSLKPSPTQTSAWLDTADFTLLNRALDAADDGQWTQVRSYLGRISDPAAQALIRWRIATNGDAGMGYSDLMKALEEFNGWPDTSKIEDQAEITITRSSLTSDERIAWLLARGPRTGEGVLALADAYHSQGKMDDRLRVIREAWRTRVMSSGAAATIQVQYAGDLSAEDHFARADMFLWRADTKSAQALLPKLTAGRKKVIEARIALMKNAKTVDKTVNAVPSEYIDDPGLLYDRARWAERKGRQSDELSYLLRINGEQAPAVGREDIWGEAVCDAPHDPRARLSEGLSAGGGAWLAERRGVPRCGVDGRVAGAGEARRRGEGRGAFPRVRRGRCDADQREPGAILVGRGADQAAAHSRSAGSVCDRFEVSVCILRPAGGGEGAPADARGDEDRVLPARAADR